MAGSIGIRARSEQRDQNNERAEAHHPALPAEALVFLTHFIHHATSLHWTDTAQDKFVLSTYDCTQRRDGQRKLPRKIRGQNAWPHQELHDFTWDDRVFIIGVGRAQAVISIRDDYL